MKKPTPPAVTLSRLLTRKEAAQLLAISIRTLDRLTKAGTYRHQKVGRSVRYRYADLKITA